MSHHYSIMRRCIGIQLVVLVWRFGCAVAGSSGQ